jgi:hypothetical protein
MTQFTLQIAIQPGGPKELESREITFTSCTSEFSFDVADGHNLLLLSYFCGPALRVESCRMRFEKHCNCLFNSVLPLN